MPIPFPKPGDPSRPRAPPSTSSDSSDDISYPPSETTTDREEEAAMIQEEWEESLRQIEMVISILVMPFLGKWYGRRAANWAWNRYLMFGWTRSFFGLS